MSDEINREDVRPKLSQLCNELTDLRSGDIKGLVVQLCDRRFTGADSVHWKELLQESMQFWLDTDTTASWSKLVIALTSPSLEKFTLAENIRKKYCPWPSTVRSGGLNTLGNTRGTTISGGEERRLCTAGMQSPSVGYQLANTPPYTLQSEQGFSGSLHSSLSSSSDPTSPPSTYHPHRMNPITASPYPLTPHPIQTASQPMLTHKQSQIPGFLHVYEQPSPTSQTNVTSSPPSDDGVKYCTMKGLINNIDTTDWYALGVQLTTNVTELNIISCDHRNDTRGALFNMFNLVLRDNPNLTWPTVVKALETIKDNKRAKKIRNKFCKNSDT